MPAVVNNAEEPSRMTRRRLETRSRLLAATLQLVLEKGIDKTTMDGITETADLGRRTLYYHFSNKYECILAAVANAYEKHGSMADNSSVASSDPALLIAMHSRRVLAGLMREPVTRRLVEAPKLLAAALAQALGQFALKDIEQGLEHGRFALQMDQRTFNSVLTWSLVGLLIQHVEHNSGADELLAAYAVLVLSNLGIPAAEARQLSEQAAIAIGSGAQR